MGKNGAVCIVVHIMLLMLISGASAAVANAEGVSESFSRKMLIGKSAAEEEFVVVFDAGSTGSRAHAFKFGLGDLELHPIGTEFEFNKKVKPGLSAYADHPESAADSLKDLLSEVQTLVPVDMQPETPLMLGATAGLRLLSEDASERILQSVRELFANGSNLRYKSEWVSVIDGFQEGSYMWVAVNYLLGNVGNVYEKTVAVVDLGGASVQMAYAISEDHAANAPKSINPDDKYLAEWNLRGSKYHLYTHSYLKYGLEAFRAQNLKRSGSRGNPCIINGYQGTFTYSGVVYNVSTPSYGNSIRNCQYYTRQVLNLDAPCKHQNCTFNGVWNGGGGDGQETLYVATAFYYTAYAANIVSGSITSTQIRPLDYRKAANIACNTHVDDMRTVFPNVREDNLPFLCMDLIYEYTLLVKGFGLERTKKIMVVQNFDYKGSKFEAAWPLGAALDLLSPPQMKLALYKQAEASS